jgi:molecular chaperone HtpG
MHVISLDISSISDGTLIEEDPELKIWVSIDKEKRLIKIRDNGIGMNKRI